MGAPGKDGSWPAPGTAPYGCCWPAPMASARMSYGSPKARALTSARTLAGQREEGLWLASARRPGQSQDARGIDFQ